MLDKKTMVIIITNYAADYAGNFIESLNALESKLKQKNCRVEYVFPKNAPFKKWHKHYKSNHIVHTTEFVSGSLTQCLHNIINNHINEHIIIHSHFISPALVHKIEKNIKEYDYEIVFQEHMRLDYSPKNHHIAKKIRNFLKSFIIRYIAKRWKLIAVSDAVYSDLVSIEHTSKNIFLIKNAISTNRLDRIYNDEYNNLNALNDVIIFGTDFRRKGVDIAIDAIKQSSYNLRLIILTHNEEDTIRQLSKTTENWEKYAVVRHVTNHIQNVYNNSLCFISPSRSEAFGYSVVEAAYCETQVIASDIPGQNSLKDIPGILWIENENSVALSKAIDKCFYRYQKQLDYLKKIKKVQKEYIRNNYNLNTWCDEIIKVYEA